MSVAPAPPVLSNPLPGMWPITLIVIVVVISVPPALVNPTLGTLITLLALLLGRGVGRRTTGRSKTVPHACPLEG